MKIQKPLFSAKWAELENNDLDEEAIKAALARQQKLNKVTQNSSQKSETFKNSKNFQNNSKNIDNNANFKNTYFHNLKKNFRSNLNKLAKNNNLIKETAKDNQVKSSNFQSSPFDFEAIRKNRQKANSLAKTSSFNLKKNNQAPNFDFDFKVFLQHFLKLENQIKILEKKLATIFKNKEQSKLSFKHIGFAKTINLSKMSLVISTINLEKFDLSFRNASFYSNLIYNLVAILNKFPWLNNHSKNRNYQNQNIINLAFLEQKTIFFILKNAHLLKPEQIKQEIFTQNKNNIILVNNSDYSNKFSMVISNSKHVNHKLFQKLLEDVSLIINVHEHKGVENKINLDFYIDLNQTDKLYLKTFALEVKKYFIK